MKYLLLIITTAALALFTPSSKAIERSFMDLSDEWKVHLILRTKESKRSLEILKHIPLVPMLIKDGEIASTLKNKCHR